MSSESLALLEATSHLTLLDLTPVHFLSHGTTMILGERCNIADYWEQIGQDATAHSIKGIIIMVASPIDVCSHGLLTSCLTIGCPLGRAGAKSASCNEPKPQAPATRVRQKGKVCWLQTQPRHPNSTSVYQNAPRRWDRGGTRA